jgi:hypothetical protein
MIIFIGNFLPLAGLLGAAVTDALDMSVVSIGGVLSSDDVTLGCSIGGGSGRLLVVLADVVSLGGVTAGVVESDTEPVSALGTFGVSGDMVSLTESETLVVSWLLASVSALGLTTPKAWLSTPSGFGEVSELTLVLSSGSISISIKSNALRCQALLFLLL